MENTTSNSDSYYENSLDREWVLNKIYIEVIIAIETGDIDYAESRMNSLIEDMEHI